MLNIILNNVPLKVENKTRIVDLLTQDQKDVYLLAKVNNRLRELTYPLSVDSKIELLDITDHEAMRVYEASLRFLFVMALKQIEPNADVEFNQFISQSTSCEFINLSDYVSSEFVTKLKLKMEELVSLDLPFVKISTTNQEALEIFDKYNYKDKKDVFKYRPDKIAHFYQCGDLIDYMFSYMVPSTKYLKHFSLQLYYPFVILQYPRYELLGAMPIFNDSPKLSRLFREGINWANTIKAATISDINRQLQHGSISDLVNICETKHNNQLTNLGNTLFENLANIKMVCIAGPSSSGKTTFTNRLRVEMLARGVKPLMISLDDYFVSRDQTPKDEDGNPDFEHIQSLDIPLFNAHMLALIRGDSVVLPKFDFKEGSRKTGKTVRLHENSFILIEGLHALNDDLTPLIPRYQKFKIYLSPIMQVKVDNHNPIATSDIRLLRRLVRDSFRRNANAISTFEIWPSVRKGEYKWIYPFQEDADYIFNSGLIYEFGILKKHALKLLSQIVSPDEKFSIEANRLIKFLKYFQEIDESLVPANSILREFIGGSSYN